MDYRLFVRENKVGLVGVGLALLGLGLYHASEGYNNLKKQQFNENIANEIRAGAYDVTIKEGNIRFLSDYAPKALELRIAELSKNTSKPDLSEAVAQTTVEE